MKKGSILEIVVSGTGVYVLFLIIFYLYTALCILSGYGKGIMIMAGWNAAVLGYFYFVSKKIIGLFEKIIRDAEGNKKDC